MIQLVEHDGYLYTKESDIADTLMREHYERMRSVQSSNGLCVLIADCGGAGVNTIKWPKYNADQLRSSLYDQRETGMMPNEKSVLLPDGTEFKIDE